MQNNVEVFSEFPIIDSEFDMVCFDVIKVEDGESHYFTPVIRYCVRNIVAQTVDAGFTLLTGFTSDSLVGVSMFVAKLVGSGMFLVDVSAIGTVYNEQWVELEEINWNHLSTLAPIQEDNLTKETRVLH